MKDRFIIEEKLRAKRLSGLITESEYNTQMEQVPNSEMESSKQVSMGVLAMKEFLSNFEYSTPDELFSLLENFKRGAGFAVESYLTDMAPNAGAAPDELE
jgi:hypothetical protein